MNQNKIWINQSEYENLNETKSLFVSLSFLLTFQYFLLCFILTFLLN